MTKIVWAYRPDDRKKQGKTEDVPQDMARAYVHDGVARYAPEEPPQDDADDDTAGEVSAAPAPKKSRVPAQSEASTRS